MKIMLVGGGSGGHITPLLAVAHELKKYDKVEILYVGQKGDGLGDVPAHDPDIDRVFNIYAGKLRRYHGESLLMKLTDFETIWLNIRDVFYVLTGMVQSFRLLRRERPSVIFIKGGFVGVPVGLMAALLKIPYITHDSDAIPGLANRIIARWAKIHAVALPKEIYNYSAHKTVTTGIPLSANFTPVDADLRAKYRDEIDMPAHAKMLLVIGGGLGAMRVNNAIAETLPHLLSEYPDLRVVQVAGRANEEMIKEKYNQELSDEQKKRVTVFGFINDVYRYSGAADIIVTRAGATNLAEFSLQGKTCIVVPSPFLAGGHQLKNAAILAEANAAEVIPEDEVMHDSNRLARTISDLFKDDARQATLASNFTKFSHAGAAADIAKLILEISQ